MSRRIYTCHHCGKEFAAFEVVTRAASGYREHPHSLIRHLLDNPECNQADAERRAEVRAQLQQDDPWYD